MLNLASKYLNSNSAANAYPFGRSQLFTLQVKNGPVNTEPDLFQVKTVHGTFRVRHKIVNNRENIDHNIEPWDHRGTLKCQSTFLHSFKKL
jgi:hypothetical protein